LAKSVSHNVHAVEVIGVHPVRTGIPPMHRRRRGEAPFKAESIPRFVVDRSTRDMFSLPSDGGASIRQTRNPAAIPVS